jgi:hypothetical protein
VTQGGTAALPGRKSVAEEEAAAAAAKKGLQEEEEEEEGRAWAGDRARESKEDQVWLVGSLLRPPAGPEGGGHSWGKAQ